MAWRTQRRRTTICANGTHDTKNMGQQPICQSGAGTGEASSKQEEGEELGAESHQAGRGAHRARTSAHPAKPPSIELVQNLQIMPIYMASITQRLLRQSRDGWRGRRHGGGLPAKSWVRSTATRKRHMDFEMLKWLDPKARE